MTDWWSVTTIAKKPLRALAELREDLQLLKSWLGGLDSNQDNQIQKRFDGGTFVDFIAG
jgi:hypothetical protein